MIYVLVFALIAVVPMQLVNAAADIAEWVLEALGAFGDES